MKKFFREIDTQFLGNHSARNVTTAGLTKVGFHLRVTDHAGKHLQKNNTHRLHGFQERKAYLIGLFSFTFPSYTNMS